MATPPRGPASPHSTSVRVSVFRVSPGGRHRVRLLSDAIQGILTHWQAGRGVYCPGEGCPVHRLAKVWKGYTPVEVWEPAGRRWIPYVLEVTEGLELTMRDCFRRGQVWELTRKQPEKKKHFPVEGSLVDEGHGVTLRPAFDMMPVLLAMYHETDMVLGVPNPMPAPVVLEIEPAAGVEPAPRPAAKPAAAAAPQMSAADLDKLRIARANIGREVHNGKATGAHP